jgi:hypothetical protein
MSLFVSVFNAFLMLAGKGYQQVGNDIVISFGRRCFKHQTTRVGQSTLPGPGTH